VECPTADARVAASMRRFVSAENVLGMLPTAPDPGGGKGASAVTEFYRQYLAVAVLIGAALLMVGAMLSAGRLLRPSRAQAEKYITYEAGSDPVGGWGQSNVRYYVYALLFVIFDVEAVFIFPWAVNLESLDVFGLIEMTIFIVLLALGLVYAWRKGVLRWA
jgi:NADH-quinone oxidoreductase subunit A